jgi:hypothetical protein
MAQSNLILKKFKTKDKNQKKIEISIYEVRVNFYIAINSKIFINFFLFLNKKLCDTDYSFYIWPCSVLMANFIYKNRLTLFNSPNSNLLEVYRIISKSNILTSKVEYQPV